MDIEATKAAALRLLDDFYDIRTSNLPVQRVMSQWQLENKRGFFLGVIQHGEDLHINQIHHLLHSNLFQVQQIISTNSQLANPLHPRTFIDDLLACYILPFHKDYNDSYSCRTHASSGPPSRSNSAADLHYVPEERELQYRDLKKAVGKRDEVCLFCWGFQQLQAAHIIAQKNVTVAHDKKSILGRASLMQKHQIQNGLLLCIICHSLFFKLKRYVDLVDNRLVVKVVNYSTLANDEKQKDYQRTVRDIKNSRHGREEDWIGIDDRLAAESNGEMALYFVDNDQVLLPSREALTFHKAACLIWRMAGGAESDDEYCPFDDDNDYVPVDYRSKNIEKWNSDAIFFTEITE